MNHDHNSYNNSSPISSGRGYAGTMDLGLRAYMLKIYNYMASALTITGAVAYLASTSEPLMTAIFSNTLLFWLVALAPLGMVIFLSSRLNQMSVSTAQTSFWVYSGLVGLSFSSLFLIYTGHSIVRVFLVTAGTFAAMSIYGYTTKKDLTSMGSFLRMGVFGIIIAMVVNMFMQSSALDLAISAIGVLIFTGLTAYDTQAIKASYQTGELTEHSEKKAIFGALSLYLDFINLFVMLLRFLGDRR